MYVGGQGRTSALLTHDGRSAACRFAHRKVDSAAAWVHGSLLLGRYRGLCPAQLVLERPAWGARDVAGLLGNGAVER
jgi:hypothetical protein